MKCVENTRDSCNCVVSQVLPSLAMASVEQPPKKRKLYEPLLEPPPSSPPSPPPPATEPTPPSPQTLPPPSQEEILAKRRNKDEIRSVFEGYKRIQRCLLNKDAPSSMVDLEKSYLALITSSRGEPLSLALSSLTSGSYYCLTVVNCLIVIGMWYCWRGAFL